MPKDFWWDVLGNAIAGIVGGLTISTVVGLIAVRTRTALGRSIRQREEHVERKIKRTQRAAAVFFILFGSAFAIEMILIWRRISGARLDDVQDGLESADYLLWMGGVALLVLVATVIDTLWASIAFLAAWLKEPPERHLSRLAHERRRAAWSREGPDVDDLEGEGTMTPP